MGEMLSPALKARGFANSEIVTRWPDLVGHELARSTRALQLKWPPRGSRSDLEQPDRGATLIIAVSGAAGLELQYSSAQIIERINAALGWRCVTKLALRQQSVVSRKDERRPETPLSSEEIARLTAATAKVEDRELRIALAKLGKGVFQRNKSRGN